MGEYTAFVSIAVVAVVVFDLAVARTRMITRASVWITLVIMWTFQVFVDGWLTKQSSPIVLYNEDEFTGYRVFFDSPIEDFAFALAMVLFTLSIWELIGRRQERGS